jgi:glycosyltransferase involved in cell wall biosynthesis
MTVLPGPAKTAVRSKTQRPLRILHVVDRMNRGGAETWLMQVLRHIDRERFHMDFMTTTDQPGAFDEQISRLGSMVHVGPTGRWSWVGSASFQRFLVVHGPYDVVHSHVHHFGGTILRSAALSGVPARIAHSHSDTQRVETHANFGRKIYVRLMDRWIRKYATCGIAVSRGAARSLFGPDWASDPRKSILYCGTDISEFDNGAAMAARIRHDVGLPPEARVYGHIGRFVEAKNHSFLVEILRRLASLDPQAVFVLAGDGPLRPSIEAQIVRAGISSRTRLLGNRSDVPALLSGLIQVLVMPSLWEGLPMVTIESQAAGVPCLCSEAVPEEAIEVPGLLRRLPLDLPPDRWAREAFAMSRPSRQPAPMPGLAGGRFDIRTGVRQLERIYTEFASQLEVL